MRIKKETFVKVTIILETKDEVEQLQGLCNYAPLVDAIPILDDIGDEIENCRNKYFDAIREVVTSKLNKET